MEEKRTEVNSFERAIADARAEIAKPALSPQGAIDAVLRIAHEQCQVDPAHADRAAGYVNEFRDAAVAALKSFRYGDLENAITHFCHQMRYSRLQVAPVPPDPNRPEAVSAWLRPHGWSSLEIECVLDQLRASDGTITAADYESVTIAGRVHSRDRLRLWAKPASAGGPWWDEQAWQAQWPKIEPVVEAAERRADDDEIPGAPGWRYDAKLGRAVKVA
jgi:hypothetical protein